MRLDQVVAGGQLEGHARERPEIGGRTVARAEYDLERAVLTRLYVLGEVVISPAGVAQVGDLDLEVPLVEDHFEHRVEVFALELGHLLRHARYVAVAGGGGGGGGVCLLSFKLNN